MLSIRSNRKVMLHNVKFLCPLISIYIYNCYVTLARLFICGGGKILSKKGTTQGDPTPVGTYAHGILRLLHFFLGFILANQL